MPKPFARVGDELADAAEAEDAERLAVELDARELRALPAAVDERRVRLRDVAREREQHRDVCSAAVTTLDCGALTTTMPRLVAAGTSTLSTPTPARPMTRRFGALLDEVGGHLRRRADEDAVVVADALGQVERLGGVERGVDVEVLAQQVDAAGADLLGDQDAGHACCSTTKSMHAVSALTSSGLDRREHRDAQLVAAELAVRLDVDDAVGAQRLGDLGGVDVVGEVDRADDERALGRVGDERRRELGARSAQP